MNELFRDIEQKVGREILVEAVTRLLEKNHLGGTTPTKTPRPTTPKVFAKVAWKNLSPEGKVERIAAMTEEGKTPVEIAKLLGTTPGRISSTKYSMKKRQAAASSGKTKEIIMNAADAANALN